MIWMIVTDHFYRQSVLHLGWAIGVSVDNKISSKNKLPTILAGVAAAELVYVIVDGVSNETSQSINRVLKSLPDEKVHEMK